MAKVNMVIHESHDHFQTVAAGRPFFGYVLGAPSMRATGRTREEVIEILKKLLIIKPGRDETREMVEVEVGDEIVVEEVMNR